MDLALCLLVFATVFGTALMLARQRETVPDRAYQNLQRLTHGIDITEEESIVSRRRTPRRELLTWFYRLNLLHRVENDLWQAGIYMRLSDFLLIVVLLFGAGVASGQLLFSGD